MADAASGLNGEGAKGCAHAAPRPSTPAQLTIPWNLDADEERVLRILVRQAYGQANAIPMVDLALDSRLTTRDLQDVIHRLVERRGMAICSSSRRGANGYWLPATPEEVAAGMADLTGRIRHLAARARALDAAAAREFTRQLALDMERS